MQFCPNCKNRLEDSHDNQQRAILFCRDCGFTQLSRDSSEPSEDGQHLQSPPAIKVMDPAMSQKIPKPTVEITCPNCGNDKAVWTMVQTDRADEPSTQFFRCTKCEHT